ncbi:unnamed protein product [Urochloa humidicola]
MARGGEVHREESLGGGPEARARWPVATSSVGGAKEALAGCREAGAAADHHGFVFLHGCIMDPTSSSLWPTESAARIGRGILELSGARTILCCSGAVAAAGVGGAAGLSTGEEGA